MTNATATARSCIFCRAPADSGEHLLPRWLQDVLPSKDPSLHYRQIGTDESERHEWMRRPFREKTRVICKGCNNGWMSSLEAESKPILTPAITRSRLPIRFAPASQLVAARWAFKTMLVFQASQGDPVAPQFHSAYLRAHRQPPPQASIWLGSNYGARFHDAAVAYVQRPLTLLSRGDLVKDVTDFGYAAFLAIGGVSFFLIGHQYRNHVEVNGRNMMADALIKVWPRSAASISWPPELMMDKQLVDMLFLPVEPPTLDVRVSPIERLEGNPPVVVEH